MLRVKVLHKINILELTIKIIKAKNTIKITLDFMPLIRLNMIPENAIEEIIFG